VTESIFAGKGGGDLRFGIWELGFGIWELGFENDRGRAFEAGLNREDGRKGGNFGFGILKDGRR
jgi:hypothetical protein